MNHYQGLTSGILLALVFGLLMPQLPIQAQSAAPLHLGDAMPDVIGESLSGNPAHLSTADAGRVAVVVFSFSKVGGKDTKLWDRELSRDFASNPSVTVSTVIMLEAAPRLLRGVILSGIKKNIPPSLQGTTIVSYENEKLWKQRLTVADESHPYVALLGQNGRIRWMNSGAFGDAEYKVLKTKSQEQLQSVNLREMR